MANRSWKNNKKAQNNAEQAIMASKQVFFTNTNNYERKTSEIRSQIVFLSVGSDHTEPTL